MSEFYKTDKIGLPR